MDLSRELRLYQYLRNWLIRSQEEAQVNTKATGVDNKSGEIQTEAYSDVFVCGLQKPSRFSPCKTNQERWLKLKDLILRLKSKHPLTARCLMSLIGLLASTEKMVLVGRFLMRPFQFHLKEHWIYPQSLDSLQVKPGTLDRMITTSTDIQTDPSKVVDPSCRSICHSSALQTSTLRVSSSRPKCLGH